MLQLFHAKVVLHGQAIGELGSLEIPALGSLILTHSLHKQVPALGGSAAFAVQVGAENELLVPFMMQNTNDYFEDYETIRFEKAFPGTYTMKMTDLPERRLLRFEVK